MKTLILGAAIVDIIMNIPILPRSGEDILCTEKKLTVGGCAYNVANILRGFNISHDLVVPIGSGIYADIIKNALNEDGYEIFINNLDDDNGYCLCLVENTGERSFITFNGVEANYKKEWFDNLNMNEYANIYLAGYQLYIDKDEVLINWLLSQKNKNIFFAPGPVINNISENVLEKIFSTNPILHLNKKEALEFTKTTNINDSILKLYQLNKNVVFITVGEKGVFFYDGKNITNVKGIKVNVIDTIGAGDSHIATIISAYSLWANKINSNYSWECYLNENNGENFMNGCLLANKVASEVVQVSGSKISNECFNKFNI